MHQDRCTAQRGGDAAEEFPLCEKPLAVADAAEERVHAVSEAAEESDAAEEFSLCEKPLAVAVRAQGDARGRAAGRLWRVRYAAARPCSTSARGVGCSGGVGCRGRVLTL